MSAFFDSGKEMFFKSLKYFGIVAIIILLWPLNMFAQDYIMEIRTSATLESMLILNIDPDISVDLGIIEVGDNLFQVTKYPDDINFSVESTENWNLSIIATDKYFTCTDDSSCRVPIEFISYYIENKGTNWDNGLFSNIANRTKDTPLPLSTEETTILVNGNKNNIGGAEQNSFILRWKLNIEDNLINMSKFSNLKIKDGYYKANFYLTLTEADSK